MLLSIGSSLMFADEKRRLAQLFPEPVRKLWNEWELRAMLVLSLVLQISLIRCGNWRKYSASRKIRIFTWSTYVMADWVATVALGVLSNQLGNSCSSSAVNTDSGLIAFWAPFLLLHLGGPDTITAYALADNELWMRHLLGLVVQTTVALYITLVAWQGTQLSILTIPMLLCGVIKYGERSWSLRCANREQFRDSVLSTQDPGPSYAKFMEEFNLKEAEGYHVTADEVVEIPVPGDDSDTVPRHSIPDANILLRADTFFENLKFKRLFVDLILSFHHRDESQSYFHKKTSETAFKVIEVELGFAYDVFYTKAPLMYTRLGFLLRFITSSFTIFVFVAFMMLVDVKPRKHQLVDLAISYILMVGAICLEAYAAISLLYSDWTYLWLSKHSKTPWFFRPLSYLCTRNHQRQKRWSNSMSQYNLLSFCLEQKPVNFQGILRFIPHRRELQKLQRKLGEKLDSLQQLRARPKISPELKDLIYNHFLKKSTDNETDIVSLCTSRGGRSLRTYGIKDEGVIWTTEVEFDQSILIWHIATDLCYHLDVSKITSNESKQEWQDHMSFSKQLADYMLYLLIRCPFMLPMGIGTIRYQDTCAEAQEFFQDRSPIADKLEACTMLTQVNTKVLPRKVKGDRSKSALFDGCKVAASLREMDKKEKWELVTDVWVEMLGYAASHCKGFYHAQQLEKGGELLTHVWLLMAHLGITEQFQISQGHARAKLAAK